MLRKYLSKTRQKTFVEAKSKPVFERSVIFRQWQVWSQPRLCKDWTYLGVPVLRMLQNNLWGQEMLFWNTKAKALAEAFIFQNKISKPKRLQCNIHDNKNFIFILLTSLISHQLFLL